MRRVGGWIIAGMAMVLAVVWALPHHSPRSVGIPAILATGGVTLKVVPPETTRITIQEALVESQTAHHNILLTPATTPTAQMVSINPGHQLAWLITMQHVTILHLRSHHRQQVATVAVLINAQNGTWMRWTPIHG